MKFTIKKALTVFGLLVLAACGSKREELDRGWVDYSHPSGKGIPIAAPAADTTAEKEPSPISDEDAPSTARTHPSEESIENGISGTGQGHDVRINEEIWGDAWGDGALAEVRKNPVYPPLDETDTEGEI